MNRALSRIASAGAIASLFLLSACGEKNCPPNAPCPTPTPGGGGCTNIAGSRNSFWSDSCGRSGSDVTVISQSGCSFDATMASLGTFSGTISNNNLSFTLTFGNPCSGTATGSGTISGSTISGTYSGTQTGVGSGVVCCSPVNGSFAMQFSSFPTATVTSSPIVTLTPIP